MDILKQVYLALPDMLLALATFAVVVGVLWTANWFLLRRNRCLGEEQRFPRRIVMAVLALIGCVVILLAVPVGAETRTQLLGLLGLLLTVVITLSSTTFVANAMAGFMLRAVGSFRSGDFIRVGEQFGRVTERGLFHTEIQTEDRDLTTLPNLYLVSNPVKVVRYSGTVVSATVSLGYDVPHAQVTSFLTEAARDAELQDSFVQIVDLGDFSVTYRIAGFLTEVKQLLTVRSNLRAMVLTALHGAGIEIVSPQFMTQRRLAQQKRVLPPDPPEPITSDGGQTSNGGQVPEERIFDKADRAEQSEQLRLEQLAIEAELKSAGESLKAAEGGERPRLESRIEQLRCRLDEITAVLGAAAEKRDE